MLNFDLILGKSEPITESGCWIWEGQIDKTGYARMPLFGASIRVHVMAYELKFGRVSEGLELDHLCRVRCCVNPDHLEAVTSRENTLRGNGATAINARKTHCVRGHCYDAQNTLRDHLGNRHCRTCRAMQIRVIVQKTREKRALFIGPVRPKKVAGISGIYSKVKPIMMRAPRRKAVIPVRTMPRPTWKQVMNERLADQTDMGSHYRRASAVEPGEGDSERDPRTMALAGEGSMAEKGELA